MNPVWLWLGWLGCADTADVASAPSPAPAASPSGPVLRSDDSPLPYAPKPPGLLGMSTDRFEVLDLDLAAEKISFKHVFQPDPGRDCPEAPAMSRCGYAGMEDLPNSAVVIGVWDLDAHRLEAHWEIYPLAERPSDCADHATSARRLAAAKEAIALLGMDVEARPASIALTAAGFTARTSKGEADDPTHGLARLEVTGPGGGYVRELEYSATMGSTGRAEADRVWVRDGRAVVLERHTLENNELCATTRTEHRFGPVLVLPR